MREKGNDFGYEGLTHCARAREAEIHDFHGHGSDAALAINLKVWFEKFRLSFLDGRHCHPTKCEVSTRQEMSTIRWLCKVTG